METFFSRHRSYIFALLAGILLLAGIYGAYAYVYIPSPRHSISLIEDAAKNGDTKTFSNMVDSQRVSESIFDALSKHASWQPDSMQPVLQLAFGPLQGEFGTNGTTYLTCLAAHDTSSTNYTTSKARLDNLLKAVGFPLSLDGWSYRSASHYKETNDHQAQADITLHNDRINADATLTIVMERIDSQRWRIIGTTNMETFLTQVEQGYAKKLAAYNKPIQERIDSAAQISAVSTELIHDTKRNAQRSYLRIHYTMQYKGIAANIKGVRVIYELRQNGDDKLLYRANTVLPPSPSGDINHLSQFLLNPIIPSQYAVSQLPDLDNTTSTMKVIAVYFKDGTNWQIADVLPEK